MHSSMIGKIEKAGRYAREQQRFHFNSFQVTLEGDHRNHGVGYDGNDWTCDCEMFEHERYCSHTMAVERVLGDMLVPPTPVAPG